LYHSIVNIGQTWYSFGWEVCLHFYWFLLHCWNLNRILHFSM
jgi:hypothetical protein